MEITTRPITRDETVRFRAAIMLGFGEDLDDDEFPPEWLDDLLPLDRTSAAFDGDHIVGTLGGLPFEITVPGGGQVPMAGTTIATVAATHRRRGVLTAMMRDHFEDGLDRGEPLIGLWASESLIYGRFGFGVATEQDAIEIEQTRITVEGDAGSVRLVSPDEAAAVFPTIYEAERLRRPGMLSRTADWWKHLFVDPSGRRRGFSSMRLLLHETDGRPDGYAFYRQKPDWESGFPQGTLNVREIIATTPTAHTGLWRFLTSIDLYVEIVHWNLPVDDPLAWKVPDHRRIKRKRWDALYLRLLDVVQAFEARTYGADGSVTLTVDDPFLPDVGGSFELSVVNGNGRCRRIDDGPTDLCLGTTDLASLYLGGHSAAAMARAGRIQGAPDAVGLFGRMVRGDIAPWCEEVF